MSKSMFVNVMNEEESRIAIVADGQLEELSIETAYDEMLEGNIYKASIEKVVPSLDACFVNYGREKNGFLALNEIRPEYYTNGERKAENLKRGQKLMVRVKKGEVGEKGAALTTYISIPGRYIVLMPFVDKRSVSRQIQDEKIRKALKKIVDDAALPEGAGYIIRTAAGEQKKQDIQRDVSFLLRLWKRIKVQFVGANAPAPLYKDNDIVIRTIRDYFTPEIKEVLVDNDMVFERVQGFFRAVMPWNTKRVKRYEGHAPLFSKHNLEQQIATIRAEKVKLPSGGSIVIQPTEALVSVDVNSGGGGGSKDIEQTALTTNLEAAREAARQLRLRDLGGLIVIDFIDMRASSGRSAVKKELSKALKTDKARTDVGSISKFGLLELSRQRIRGAKPSRISTPCPHCGGTGTLRSTESVALMVLRTVQGVLARNRQLKRVAAGVSVDAATYLLNRKRVMLGDLERRFGVSITIFAEPELTSDHFFLEFHTGDGKPRTETNLPDGFPVDRLLLSRGLPLPELEPEEETATSYADLHDEEVPDEPMDEENGAPLVEPEEQPESASKKRRRRRRRKKKGNDEQAAEQGDEARPPEEESFREAVQSAPDAALDAGSATEGEPPEEIAAEGVAAEPVPVEEGGEKKKRSRRRRGGRGRGRGRKSAEARGEAAGEAAGEATVASSGEGAPQPSAMDMEAAIPLSLDAIPTETTAPAEPTASPESPEKPMPEAPAEKRPARRRRAGSGAAKAKEPAPAQSPEEVVGEPAGQSAFVREAASEEPAPEKAKPKKPRVRRTPAKSAKENEVSNDASPDTFVGTPPETPAGAPVESKETAPKKPRAKRTTAKATKAKTKAQELSPEASSEVSAAPDEAARKESKPKKPRTRRTTAKKTDKATKEADEAAATTTGEEEKPAAKKPSTRRPPRKKAAEPKAEPGTGSTGDSES